MVSTSFGVNIATWSLTLVGVKDLQYSLKLKIRRPSVGQTPNRHLQILQFMYWQLKCPDMTRKEAALNVATGFGKGRSVAERIMRQEKTWIQEGSIQDERQGKHAKVIRLLEDEGTELAAREYCEEAGDNITAQGLAKAVTAYWTIRTNCQEAHQRVKWIFEAFQKRHTRGKGV